ncbi:hypothetical protein FD942_25310 [Escherichia coli]|nr:hypothetical protein [Escherichia coli]EFC6618935.1 hypothetical protein [Escherichia coli]EFO2388931.1 hypothetical protein [Escherichia coli]EFO3008731.1 hypothetical protein [Escherichia coli]
MICVVISTIQNLEGEFSSFPQWGILEQSTGYALPAKKHINCNGNRYGRWRETGEPRYQDMQN